MVSDLVPTEKPQLIELPSYEEKLRDQLVHIAENAPLEQAAELVKVAVANIKQATRFEHKFRCFKNDGAYALDRAVRTIMKFQSHGTKGPSGETPTTIVVTFPDGTVKDIPWGKVNLPTLGEDAFIKMQYINGFFYMTGQVEQQYSEIMSKIAAEVRYLLKNDSLYKNCALVFNSDMQPEFLNLDGYEDRKIYLSKKVKFQLKPIEARLLKPEKTVQRGVELKYGALLAGTFGTGKTLLAFKLASEALKKGWTFLYLKDPTKTAEMILIANRLSTNGTGVLLFVEDIDLVMRGNRDREMNQILNNLDGGDTKGNNVISIFTTNYLELIDPTFMRGKRISELITLGHLDEWTARKFIEGYFEGDTIDGDITKACKMMERYEVVPSFAAEILDKVSSYMVLDETDVVSTSNIEAAILSYVEQMNIARTKKASPSPSEVLGSSLAEVLKPAIATSVRAELDKTQLSSSDKFQKYCD